MKGRREGREGGGRGGTEEFKGKEERERDSHYREEGESKA